MGPKTSQWDKWKVIFSGIGIIVILATFSLATIEGKVKQHDNSIDAHLILQNKRDNQYTEIISRFNQAQTNDSLLSYQLYHLQSDFNYVLLKIKEIHEFQR